MQWFNELFSSVPLANGNPFMGVVNVLLTVVLGAFGKGSLHWVRDYERMVMTRPRGMVEDKKTGLVRVFSPGLVVRPAFMYTSEKVHIRNRTDDIVIEVMRPGEDGRTEKWKLSATAKWYVNKELDYPYRACPWLIEDLGEFVRGAIADGLITYLEEAAVNQRGGTIHSNRIFSACEPGTKAKLEEHGVVWSDLLIREHALSDPEVMGLSIRRIAFELAKFTNFLFVEPFKVVRHRRNRRIRRRNQRDNPDGPQDS